MDKEQLIDQLIHFLKTDPSCQQTIACLTDRAELSLVIAHEIELTVQHRLGKIEVLRKKAIAPDFIFYAQPSAVETLIAEAELSPAKLGIKLLKQIISREIKVSMPVNVFQITQHGYLNILKVGGIEFLNELKNHGLSNVPKILSALRNLRKQP